MELLLIPVVVFGLWLIKSIRQDLWDNACLYDPGIRYVVFKSPTSPEL